MNTGMVLSSIVIESHRQAVAGSTTTSNPGSKIHACSFLVITEDRAMIDAVTPTRSCTSTW